MSARLSDLLAQSAAQRAARSEAGQGGGRKKTSGPARRKAGEAGLFTRMQNLYTAMEEAYRACADQAGLSCAGCERNCCTSFFRHHTYVEWAFLWRGLNALDEEGRKLITVRAKDYMEQTRAALASGDTPFVMCPLNEKGLCVLYSHRLMICRMHGTRNFFTLPDGGQRVFPGCVRFAELPCARPDAAGAQNAAGAQDVTGAPDASGAQEPCPSLDRTPFYTELAALETLFLQRAGRPQPRVNLTIAEMILLGPPVMR